MENELKTESTNQPEDETMDYVKAGITIALGVSVGMAAHTIFEIFLALLYRNFIA